MTGRAPPDATLQLQWIFGYNGVAKRNVHFLSEDAIVYFTAGVGVVYRLKEKTQKYFHGHNDDITCLTVSEDKTKVATGQIGDDPYICVWQPFTLETLSVLKDAHMTGIRRVQFNCDGKYLASLGMDDPSTLVVWSWQRGVSVASTTAHSARVVDLSYSPFHENELATCGEHHLRLWQQLGNSFKSHGAVFGDSDRLQTLTCVVYQSEKTLLTGTEKGQVYVWRDRQLHEIIEEAHEGPLLCLALAREGLVTGGEDGHVKLWTTHFDVSKTIRARSPALHKDGAVTSVSWEHGKFLIGTRLSEIFLHESTSDCYMQGHGKGEVWGLCPYPENYLFATAGEDHTVRVWDVEKRELLQGTRLDLPAMSCAVKPDSSEIAVGLKYGTVVILNARKLKETARFSDRKEDISELKFSPDGHQLAVGSHDSAVDVYDTKEYSRTAQLLGASSYITHLDWSSCGRYIELNSGAGERLAYTAIDGKQVTDSDQLASIEWFTRTGVLGSQLDGIWPRYSDLTDINSADVDRESGVVVTGDDFGLVKLFRFPCRKKGSKYRSFVGHSEHVTGVRFTSGRTHVISVGGGDRSVFVWKYQPGSSESGHMVAVRRSVQFSEDDERDTDDEQFPEIYTDVENEQSVLKPSRISRKRREKRSLAGSHRGVPQQQSSLNVDTKLPEAGLKLKFAYGYRGHDTRNNLHFSQSGHLVYHLAALGIVYDPASNGMRFYEHHTDDILCLAMQAGSDVVATGQMGAEPAIHVWSADTLETLSVLSGHHQRAVLCVALSQQGSVLASVGGDDHHMLVLWNWRSGQKLASARGHSDKVFDLAFDPANPHKLMTAGVRHIRFWTRSGGGLTWKRAVLGNLDNQDTMLCCAISGDGTSFSGGASGSVYTWQNGKVARTVRAHRGPVYCISTLHDGYLTGGQDGYICLWDQEFARCLKIYPVSNAYVTGSEVTLTADHPSIRACAMGEGRIVAGTQRGEIIEIDQDGSICVLMSGHGRGEVWGLDTHPTTLEFATVSDDRSLRVWNRGAGPHVHIAQLRKPARSVAYNSDGSCLAVGFLDGSVSLYSADTLLRAASVHHRDSQMSAVRFSPRAVRGAGFLAAASHDDVIDLYHWAETGQLRRVAVCKDASSYITHIDWLADGRLIRSSSGAGELLYHDCPAGRRQLVPSSVEPLLDWHTETCLLSPRVAGVWAPEDDLTDINALDRSPDHTLVATACDDGGLIKLFRYPALEKWCRFRKYTGHSSHVTSVRWTHDGQFLVSVGGADCSVLVWSRVLTSEYVPGYTNPLDPDSGDELTVHDLELAAVSGAPPGDAGKLTTHRRPPHVSGERVTALYLQDGEVYAVVTRTNIVGYNIKEGTQVLGIQHEQPVLSCAAVSAHNPRLLAVGETESGSSISVIDVAQNAGTVAMLMTPKSSDEDIFRMRFSDSGRFLLCCVYKPGQYILRVWNWKKAMQMAQAEVNGTLLDADFSPSDDLKITVICAKQVFFGKIVGVAIQLKKGYIPRKKKGSDRRFLCVACGPDHTSYTGTNDGRLLVWKGPIMSQVVEVSQNGPVTSVAVNRSGSALLTAVRSVQNSILLHRWTSSIAVEWTYSLEVPPSAHIQSVSWTKGHVLVTTIEENKAHVTEVSMKEKKHRELMEVML